jgi:hypothetical protein
MESLTAIKKPAQSIAPAAKRSGKTIYLATTTSDLQPDRDRIRRELVARGHVVLPDSPLPLVYDDLVTTVSDYLQQCQVSIHPLGGMYGVVPEGAEQSILEVQNLLAARNAATGDLQRVIWIPKGHEINDVRQSIWVEQVKQDPDVHRGADIVEDSLEGLKIVMIDLLAPKKKAPVESEPSNGPGPPRVYLVCDKRDVQAVELMEDYLFDQGLEVSLPDFEADETEAAEIHRQNLTDCDAAIVFYGAARHAWVDIKLRSLLKATGYGRSRELQSRTVFIAPPFDRRKERFRTHLADVIRQEERFDPKQLEPLVRRLKESQQDD